MTSTPPADEIYANIGNHDAQRFVINVHFTYIVNVKYLYIILIPYYLLFQIVDIFNIK